MDKKPHSGTALVTGAVRRIGMAIAQRLVHEGFAVALHCSARSRVETEALAAQLIAKGGTAQVFEADLADMASVEGLVGRVHAAMGPLSLLVNNASVFSPNGVADFAAEQWDKHFAVNLRTPIVLARQFAAQAQAGEQASIINIIDQRVWRLNPHYFTYTLSKAALWSATQTMAQAFAPNVRVNAIGPGPVLPNEEQGHEGFAQEVAGVPLQLAVEPQAIADAVLYLARAHYVTGQMIAVDSGQHLGWKTPDIVE